MYFILDSFPKILSFWTMSLIVKLCCHLRTGKIFEVVLEQTECEGLFLTVSKLLYYSAWWKTDRDHVRRTCGCSCSWILAWTQPDSAIASTVPCSLFHALNEPHSPKTMSIHAYKLRDLTKSWIKVFTYGQSIAFHDPACFSMGDIQSQRHSSLGRALESRIPVSALVSVTFNRVRICETKFSHLKGGHIIHWLTLPGCPWEDHFSHVKVLCVKFRVSVM